jgi:hypothetical protein
MNRLKLPRKKRLINLVNRPVKYPFQFVVTASFHSPIGNWANRAYGSTDTPSSASNKVTLLKWIADITCGSITTANASRHCEFRFDMIGRGYVPLAALFQMCCNVHAEYHIMNHDAKSSSSTSVLKSAKLKPRANG